MVIEGIPIKVVVMNLAKVYCQDYNQREALKKAWAIAKEICKEGYNPASNELLALGICPTCLAGGWITGKGGQYKCMNCGDEFIIFEYQGVKV